MRRTLALLAVFASPLCGQQAGQVTPETHPALTIYKCTTSGGCVAQTAKLVLNSNWRWLHGPAPNYVSSHTWNSALCPDPVTCAQNCYLDGARYDEYGITTSGDALTMLLFPQTGSIGTRVHLLSDDTHYYEMSLKNQEISFDVDVSALPCGTNGAAYLLNMAADGGQFQNGTNQAGAAYGTGYCDAQCPQDPKFINGEANLLDWNPDSQTGQYGSCCPEMDLWEANSASTAYTAHPCSTVDQYRCSGSLCGSSGVCDKSGCDYNPYRMGNPSFYGPSKTLDTGTRFRITTQFLTNTNTTGGTVAEIRRLYTLPSGQIIANPPASQIPGTTTTTTGEEESSNALTDTFCATTRSAFNEPNTFATIGGGMNSMSRALALGMVPTFSVWVDYATQMLWLDSVFPPEASGDGSGSEAMPGVVRGSCPANPPADQVGALKSMYPDARVRFENVRFGDVGATGGWPWPI